MIDRKLAQEKFNSSDQRSEVILNRRASYASLLASLGNLGTEVRVNRKLKNDADTPPYSFVIGAEHEFIFPPQPTTAETDHSRMVVTEPRGHEMSQQDVTRVYDENLVSGHVMIKYDDSGDRVDFRTIDLIGLGSVVGVEVIDALERALPLRTEPAI